MNSPIRRIAINTGGGDAPGLNAVIQSAVHAAVKLGWEILGIHDGYDGLLEPQAYVNGGFTNLTLRRVQRIANLGGTILGTTNRGNPFKSRVVRANGEVGYEDRSDQLIASLRKHGVDALIAIGGDGSLAIAHELAQKGVRLVGVPKTIDNDLSATAITFGFDSAVSFATNCIDRLHTTAESHRRVMIVEVMGRHAGWIALHSGIAGGADVILIPEIPFDIQMVASHIQEISAVTDNYCIVVVAEGAFPRGGDVSIKGHTAGGSDLLGGMGEKVAQQLHILTGKDARTVVLGHLLRGGSPTALDRLLGLSLGAAAVQALADGQSGVMVAVTPPSVTCVPLIDAIKNTKLVSPDSQLVKIARAMGICFGD